MRTARVSLNAPIIAVCLPFLSRNHFMLLERFQALPLAQFRSCGWRLDAQRRSQSVVPVLCVNDEISLSRCTTHAEDNGACFDAMTPVPLPSPPAPASPASHLSCLILETTSPAERALVGALSTTP
jgi:hypothetical protein